MTPEFQNAAVRNGEVYCRCGMVWQLTTDRLARYCPHCDRHCTLKACPRCERYKTVTAVDVGLSGP